MSELKEKLISDFMKKTCISCKKYPSCVQENKFRPQYKRIYICNKFYSLQKELLANCLNKGLPEKFTIPEIRSYITDHIDMAITPYSGRHLIIDYSDRFLRYLEKYFPMTRTGEKKGNAFVYKRKR